MSEDEGEEVEVEDTKGGVLRLSPQEDPPRSDDALVSSSGTFDDLISINFTHLVASPGITLEGLAGLWTPESRIDPIDQSSNSIMATTSYALEAPSTTAPTQGGAIMATTSHTLKAPTVTAPVHQLASHRGATS